MIRLSTIFVSGHRVIEDESQKVASQVLRETMSEYRRSEDLINLGAYAAGSNPRLDAAIRERPAIDRFLRQGAEERIELPETLTKMKELAGRLG